MVQRSSTRNRWLTLGASAIAAVTVSGPAQGFYFKGWPGDGIPKETILVNPKVPPYENPPGTPDTEPPKENPKEFPPGNPPPGVPEPASGLAAVVGLAVLGVARRLRRRQIG